MNNSPVLKDERTVFVENASYRLAFMIASFGMLAAATYRGFVYKQDTWDLLGLVIFSNLVAMIYQSKARTLHRRLIIYGLIVAAVAAVVAFLFTRLFPPA